jgi:ribonuclease BN (tRNA processing enzyme)
MKFGHSSVAGAELALGVALEQGARTVKITLVPSAVSHGEAGRGFFTTSYLINDAVAIDAGGLGLLGDLTSQNEVKHVFLSHSHIDHIASLPIFIETVYESPAGPVTLHASEATLDCLKRDVFNDRVWPDFIGMSEKGLPFLSIDVLEPGRPIEAAGLRVTPVEVDHVVPTLGFLVETAGVAVVIASDTGPTEGIWKAAREADNLRAVFLEASFPEAMHPLAMISKHLTPKLFAAEAHKLLRSVPFVAVHIKPRFYEQVVAELRSLDLPDLLIGQPGHTYEFEATR